MATGDFSDVIEGACESVGLSCILEAARPRLVTDHGAALISRDFGRYLEIKGNVLLTRQHVSAFNRVRQQSPNVAAFLLRCGHLMIPALKAGNCCDPYLRYNKKLDKPSRRP